MPAIHLYGGELDGFWMAITGKDRPEIFYAPTLSGLDYLKSIKDHLTRDQAFKEMGILAYRFEKIVVNGEKTEFRYTRCAEQDRPSSAASDASSL